MTCGTSTSPRTRHWLVRRLLYRHSAITRGRRLRCQLPAGAGRNQDRSPRGATVRVGERIMDAFLKDIRYGIRGLLKRPGFTSIAVLTLALGIGANTTIFSTVDALILHPFSFPNQDRLVVVW